jgi:hypothetical protein
MLNQRVRRKGVPEFLKLYMPLQAIGMITGCSKNQFIVFNFPSEKPFFTAWKMRAVKSGKMSILDPKPVVFQTFN